LAEQLPVMWFQDHSLGLKTVLRPKMCVLVMVLVMKGAVLVLNVVVLVLVLNDVVLVLVLVSLN